MQSFVKPSRPQVTIDLVGQKNGLVPSYTTWDHIDGTAAVEVDHDTPFDEVEITLEGEISRWGLDITG